MSGIVPVGTELLSCPPVTAGGLAMAIRRRGNVPVTIGLDCMIELTPHEIVENWTTTCEIRKAVAGAMMAELGHRLCLSLATDEPQSESLAGEAAACLFLALHHRNMPLHEALEGCRVVWNDQRRRETVEYLS